MKVYIATSRSIGLKCREWAIANRPDGVSMGTLEDCDIFISVLYDKLLTEEFIVSKQRCFNFHPGLLPHYRGAGAYSWAIINQEKVTGITLHEIDKDIDSGRLIDIKEFKIKEKDTAEILYSHAMEILFEMFKFWFLKLLKQEYPTIKTIPNPKIYYRKDLEEAKDLTKFVRALTFTEKENAYYYTAIGKKIYLDYYAS